MKFSQYLEESQKALREANSLDESLRMGLELLARSMSNQGTLYFCGNGGSAADSQHWAAEFVGRFRLSGRALPAVSLTTNTSILTAIANDFSYDEVFSRQIEATGKSGDVLVAISTSGNSKSIVNAVLSAKRLGIATLGVTGESGGALLHEVDHCIKAPSSNTEVIQLIHLAIGHYLAGELEASFR